MKVGDRVHFRVPVEVVGIADGIVALHAGPGPLTDWQFTLPETCLALDEEQPSCGGPEGHKARADGEQCYCGALVIGPHGDLWPSLKGVVGARIDEAILRRCEPPGEVKPDAVSGPVA